MASRPTSPLGLQFANSASIDRANAESASNATASTSSGSALKCRYDAFGETPTRRAATRNTMAFGPPSRASSVPASTKARYRLPWW